MTALRFAPPTRFIFHLLALLLLLGIVSPLHAMQVSLAWDANDPVPEGYRLYQRGQGGSYDYSAPVWSGTQTSSTVANLADDTTYFFVVRAFSGTDISGDSNEVTVQTPPPAIVSYTIAATAGANGSITPSGSTSVVHGGSQTYTIAADSGYHIAGVLVNGVSVGAVSSYTFSQVGASQTISAAFALNTYTLSATAGANGSITPSGSTSVVHGGSQTYTIAAASGYHIAACTGQRCFGRGGFELHLQPGWRQSDDQRRLCHQHLHHQRLGRGGRCDCTGWKSNRQQRRQPELYHPSANRL
jgi:hypothetical protein